MTRAANMQALTNDIKRRWPGATVYGIGDEAHQTRASDHNEDDTSGSKAAQSDPDGRAEHRAIDIMVRGPFTKADGDALVARLLADPKARARLYGIIWHGSQWWRSSGWVRQARTTDRHDDHVHLSGYAKDDENTASWPAVAEKKVEAPDMTPEEHAWLATVHRNLTVLDGRNPVGQIYTRMALGEDAATANDYAPAHPTLKSIGAQVSALQSGLAALAGRDFTDEPAIIQGVLAGLTPEAIAAAIPPTMAKQVADELARRLVAGDPVEPQG